VPHTVPISRRSGAVRGDQPGPPYAAVAKRSVIVHLQDHVNALYPKIGPAAKNCKSILIGSFRRYMV
jgi:hypothetical protein